MLGVKRALFPISRSFLFHLEESLKKNQIQKSLSQGRLHRERLDQRKNYNSNSIPLYQIERRNGPLSLVSLIVVQSLLGSSLSLCSSSQLPVGTSGPCSRRCAPAALALCQHGLHCRRCRCWLNNWTHLRSRSNGNVWRRLPSA